MGKRKLHEMTYYQCDWTGVPMRSTNCYIPDWNEAGKLLKHGSYCCWEAVVAHADELYEQSDPEKFIRIREHIKDLVGCVVYDAPHWRRLRWLQPSTYVDPFGLQPIESPEDFLKEVVLYAGHLTFAAVVVDHTGDAYEVLCNQTDAETRFSNKLQHPKQMLGPDGHLPQSFVTARKKLHKDRDLVIFYWPFKNGLPYNTVASNLFKMQIYGDVLLVQQTREPCFLPRERFVNFTLPHYHEHFIHKAKRKDPTTCPLSNLEYDLAKAQMQSELQGVEAAASANAVLPGEIAKASVLPPPTGKELARIARARAEARAEPQQ